MNRRFLLLILTLVLLPIAGRAKAVSNDTISARRAFINFDIDHLELIDNETRLTMLNYYDIDSIPKFANGLKGASQLQKLTRDFLDLRLTDVSTLQLKVLPIGNGNEILMSLYTIGDPGDMQETEIKFFDSNLKELDKKRFFSEPALSSFFKFPAGSKMNMKEIEKIIPFYSVSYSVGPDSNDLTCKLKLGDSMNVEDAKLVNLYLQPGIVMKWDGKKFKTQ